MYQFCAACGSPLNRTPSNATLQSSVAEGSPQAGSSHRTDRSSHRVEKRDLRYLLEDDEPQKSRVAPVILVLALFALGAFGWYKVRPIANGGSASTEVASTAPSGEVAKPSDNAPIPAPSPMPQQASPESITRQEPQAPTSGAEPSPQPATAEPVTPQPTTPQPPSARESASATPPTEPSTQPENEPESSTESTPEEVAPAKPAVPAPKPVAKPTPKPAPPKDPVKEAEAYLYGRGVPQNCDRALSMLKALADKSNARARSSLGSMYATGHCVSRDLPTAYRYFALVLRTDPENDVASQNLSNIWKQMTPPERQAATR